MTDTYGTTGVDDMPEKKDSDEEPKLENQDW